MALSQITPSLFLSGSDGARSSLVSQKGITLVVNATLCHPSAAAPGVQVVRVPVCDLPSARLDRHFDSVAERIHGNPGVTLVHCAAGTSRSPALVMAYLMRFRGASLRQAHAIVRDKRPNIQPNRGFWQQLLTYERKLYGRNSVRLAEEEMPRTGSSPLIPGSSPLIPGSFPLIPGSSLRSSSFASSLPLPLTPRQRRAESASNRKCLGHVTQSPLLRHRGAAVHSGRLAEARHVLNGK